MLENTESHRKEDENGYVTVERNPIIRAGIFPYLGSQLPDAAEPARIYNVYRPLEELTKPETLESFKGLPIIDNHLMLGEKYGNDAAEKGVHGATLENITVSGNDILAPLRIFSGTLKSLIDAGKRGLSLGYRTTFEKTAGEFQGICYDYIQRNIFGNHLALVNQGRNGTAVLDSIAMDEFDLNLQENKMADEAKKEPEKKEGGEEGMTLEKVHGFMKDNAPMWHELQAMMAGEGDDKESALDAEEEKKKAEDADKDDKDCEDEKEEEKEKKAEDKKEDAMDSAAISALIESKIADFKKGAIKTLAAGLTARDALAKRLAPHVGTFACDTMDASEVAAYGAKKLGISGGVDAVNAYLAAAEKFKSTASFAMDSGFNSKPKVGGKLAATLEKAS